jgi:hypothetical protein
MNQMKKFAKVVSLIAINVLININVNLMVVQQIIYMLMDIAVQKDQKVVVLLDNQYLVYRILVIF